MKDIVKAMQEYEAYIEAHNNGDDSVNIYDYMARAGYSDLDEYHRDEQEYKLTHLDFDIIKFQDSTFTDQTVIDMSKVTRPTIHWSINDVLTPHVFIPRNNEQCEYIEGLGCIPVIIPYTTGYGHGVIVSGYHDLRFVINIPKEIDIDSSWFLYKMENYLKRYFDDVIIDKNDILINNMKVVGCVNINTEACRVCCFQISFSDNHELIYKICGKQSKTPGFIDPSIVSPEELKNEFIEWLQSH